MLTFLMPLQLVDAATPPLICAGGAPLGWIDIKVTRAPGAAPLDLQRVNQLLDGDTISYSPVNSCIRSR
jgi:hypothetical protein